MSIITPSQSTYVSYGAPGNNYSDRDRLRAGVQSDTSTRYVTLIQFDLSSILSHSTVNSAALRLYSYDDDYVWNSQTTLLAQRNTEAFTQSTVTYTTRPATTTSDQASCTDGGYNKWYVWDVQAAVQAWVNGETNYGWTIIQNGLTTARGKVFKKYDLYAPQLVIDYTPIRIKIVSVAGAIDKQVVAIKIANDAGPIDKTVIGMKIVTAQGGPFKTVF
jgi:hypothetical protein